MHSVFFSFSRIALLIAAVMLGGPLSLRAIEVEGIGTAVADLPNAREVALTDALRDAVNRGVGVDLLADTRVTDFQLQYDRIFASSFGYVKSYRIVSQGPAAGHSYEVRIVADVEKGQPEAGQLAALRMINSLRGSPRVAIEIDESIENLTTTGSLTGDVMAEIARDAGLNVVDTATVVSSSGRQQRRDEALGDTASAQTRRMAITATHDVILRVKISGSYKGRETMRNGLTVNKFAFALELSAIDPDTAQVYETITIPVTAGGDTESDPQLAAKAYLRRLLLPDAGQQKSAATLITRIYAHWITDLDLGRQLRIEFNQIDRADWDAVIVTLQGTAQVGAVQPREFDARLTSVLDVETRLDADSLATLTTRSLGADYTVDQVRPSLIVIRHQPAAATLAAEAAAAPAAPASDTAAASVTGSSFPLIPVAIGAIILVGLLAAVGGGIAVAARKKKTPA